MTKLAKVQMDLLTQVRGAMSSGPKKTFKAPTEFLQHVIFDYSASNNNNNVFVEKVKNLGQHIAVSSSIIHYAPTVSYAVRTLNAPAFEAPVNPEKKYKVGYDDIDLREYLDKSN